MKITFLGHATLEIQINEYSIVVDPFISGNPSASVSYTHLTLPTIYSV